MSAVCAEFDLPPVMKLEDCEVFNNFLQDAIGQPVAINCGQVTRLPGLAAQSLLAAKRRWETDELPFSLNNMTDDFIGSVERLGLTQDFSLEGASA